MKSKQKVLVEKAVNLMHQFQDGAGELIESEHCDYKLLKHPVFEGLIRSLRELMKVKNNDKRTEKA